MYQGRWYYFKKPCQLFATQEPGFVKISFLMPKVSANGLFQNTHLSKVHWNFNSFQSARIGSNPAPTTFKTYEKGYHWQQQNSLLLLQAFSDFVVESLTTLVKAAAKELEKAFYIQKEAFFWPCKRWRFYMKDSSPSYVILLTKG